MRSPNDTGDELAQVVRERADLLDHVELPDDVGVLRAVSFSSVTGPSFSSVAEALGVEAHDLAAVADVVERSPSTSGDEQTPWYGQSLTRPAASFSWVICQRNSPSSRGRPSARRGRRPAWIAQQPRCSCRRRPCRRRPRGCRRSASPSAATHFTFFLVLTSQLVGQALRRPRPCCGRACRPTSASRRCRRSPRRRRGAAAEEGARMTPPVRATATAARIQVSVLLHLHVVELRAQRRVGVEPGLPALWPSLSIFSTSHAAGSASPRGHTLARTRIVPSFRFSTSSFTRYQVSAFQGNGADGHLGVRLPGLQLDLLAVAEEDERHSAGR